MSNLERNTICCKWHDNVCVIDTSNKITISNMLTPHNHHVGIVAIRNSRTGVDEEVTIHINNSLGIIYSNINRHCIIITVGGMAH